MYLLIVEQRNEAEKIDYILDEEKRRIDTDGSKAKETNVNCFTSTDCSVQLICTLRATSSGTKVCTILTLVPTEQGR